MLSDELKKDIKIYGTAIHNACVDAVLNARYTNFPVFTDWVGIRLDGACAIASYHLMKKLKSKYKKDVHFILGGFKVSKDRYYNHCWLHVNDHIVDITATQFNYVDKVKVLPLAKNSKYLPEYKNKKALDEVSDWDGQNPFNYKINWYSNDFAKLQYIGDE